MEEEEYIELQNLLVKLRVNLFKEIANNNLIREIRDRDVKMIRSIDNLRKHTPLFVKAKEEI